jgi:hypothetical protein
MMETICLFWMMKVLARLGQENDGDDFTGWVEVG